MKKTKIFLTMLLLTSTLLTSCNNALGSNENDYIEKQVPVYHYDMEKLDTSALCRFYKEYPTIPYIDINSYYKYLLNKEVIVSPVKDNIYSIETSMGNATIDVENDILYSEDYNQFINTTIYRSNESHNTYYDGAPYLKVGTFNSNKTASPKTIDFKKYKIDFKYHDNKIWAPLITFSDIFKGVTMIQSFYDGKNIYFMDSNNLNVNPCFSKRAYYKNIKETYYPNNVRNAKVAELSYLEMCFVIDNYYGLPGRSPLDEMISEHGLDYALENYSESSKLVKKFLLSTDLSEYIAGMKFLDNLLNDGGHTVIAAGISSLYNSGVLSFSIKNEIDTLINKSGYEYIPNSRNFDENAYAKARNNSTQNQTFVSKGDTFIYKFDMFDIDYDAWNDYYAGISEELPNDSIGNFHRGISQAKDNKSIKNFVIDITINGGGFGDVVMYLMNAIANKPSMYYYDHIDKRHIKQDYLCDLNLDGEFNELDSGPIAGFNFGILTSQISFSCANLLPALAKDNGIAILGEDTGGGACAVLDNCSMEGLYYRTSSFVHLNNSNFESIDAGVKVDYDLVNINGSFSLSNLYNIDLISEKMNEYY